MKKKEKCETKQCRKKKAKTGNFCYTCIREKYKSKPENLLRYCYGNLKRNAKRREKEFTITFEEFKEFAIKTNYIVGRGKRKDSFHIDRIDETRGYHIDNIQVLTNTENVRKMLKARYGYDGVPIDFTVINQTKQSQSFTTINNEDDPF